MTKVKICGLSTAEAVETAVLAGADYIGFVFAKSKRQVSLEQAHELARLVTGPTKIVGVFVSPSLEDLEQAIAQVPLDIVQIHGYQRFQFPSFARSRSEMRKPKCQARQIICSLMLQ